MFWIMCIKCTAFLITWHCPYQAKSANLAFRNKPFCNKDKFKEFETEKETPDSSISYLYSYIICIFAVVYVEIRSDSE